MESVCRVKDVGVQWEPSEPHLDLDLSSVSCPRSAVSLRGHREVGVQCDRAETTESGVQVDLLTQALSGASVLLRCVRAEGPAGGALLQHCSRPNTRGRPRLNQNQTRARPEPEPDQELCIRTRVAAETENQTGTGTKTRTRTREIRPSRKYQDYEVPESPERKRRRRIGPEEDQRGPEEDQSTQTSGRDESDPNWTPAEPHRAPPPSQNFVSHDAPVRVKLEPGLRARGGVVCDVCGKVLKTKSSLSRHALVHSGSKPHGCPHCPLRFNRKDNLLHHLRHLHPDGPAPRVRPRPPHTWLCHTCGKTFNCRSRLQTHEVIHSGVKPCKCPLCPKAYMRIQDLEHHLKTVHPNGASQPPPPPQLLCHLCGHEFKSKSMLSLHLQQHTGERPHLCHLCGRKFSRKQQLRAHSAAVHREGELRPGQQEDEGQKLETEDGDEMENGEDRNGLLGDSQFVCDICGRRMKTSALLETHLSVHSGEKPFHCGLCGKGFQRAATLKQHQVRLHLRAKPALLSPGPAPSRPCSYPCSACGRSFRFRSLLLAHAAVHSDLRPFCCDLCPRSFRRRSHLKRHAAVVHPDGRPRQTYLCPVCGLDQHFSSKLQRHLLVHSGERPYSCDRCGQSFGRLGNLQQHQRRIHGDRIQRRRRGNDDDDEDTPPVCVFNDEEMNEDTLTYKQEDTLLDHGQAGSEVAQAGSEVAQAGSEVAQAGSEVVEGGGEVLEPENVVETGKDLVEAAHVVVEAVNVVVEGGSEVVVAGNEVVEAGSEVVEAGNEVVEGGKDAVEADSVVIEAVNDVVLQDGAELTQVEVSSTDCS